MSRDDHSGLIALGLAASDASLPYTVRVVDTKVGLLVKHMLGSVAEQAVDTGEAQRIDLDDLIARAELAVAVQHRNPRQ